jgi:hypothetical protein
MKGEPSEYGLEFLLAFDGRIHHLEDGYWIKFEIKRVRAAKERPHGLSYTLHAPDGTRLVGFDNAHKRSGDGVAVQTAAGCERPLAPNGERSRAPVSVQGRRDPDRRLFLTRWSGY